ncbi:MAG TPA: hypothetical protein VLW84_02020 [Terriglobales bacterium]|nr:hypothetical protein [Terriglobales bacterium]
MQAQINAGNAGWRSVYAAAILESDRNRIPARIAEAEARIANRARELFETSNSDAIETEALDDALYMLRALKNCLSVDAPISLAA